MSEQLVKPNKILLKVNYIIIFVELILLLFVFKIISHGYNNSLVFGLLSIFATFFLYIYLLKKYPIFFVFMFLFFFGDFFSIISCLFIEQGAYITEQARYGFVTGSIQNLVFYQSIFYLSSLFVFILIFPRKKGQCVELNEKKFMLIFSFSIIVIFITIFGLIKNGSPLLMQIDRFTYWANYPNVFFQKISGQIYVIAFLLGLVYVKGKPFFTKRNIISVLLLFLLLICLIFQGEKFSGLYKVIYLYILPIAVNKFYHTKNKVSILKMIPILIIIGVFLVSIIIFHYTNIHSGLPASQTLMNRIALQGHVWWGIDELIKNGEIEYSYEQLRKEISSFFSIQSNHKEVGSYYLMQKLAPEDLVEIYYSRGVKFTGGYPAIGLITLGPFGLLILQIIFGSITAVVARFLFVGIINNNVIETILILKMFFELQYALSMGDLYVFFSIEVLIYLLILICFKLFLKILKKSKDDFQHA